MSKKTSKRSKRRAVRSAKSKAPATPESAPKPQETPEELSSTEAAQAEPPKKETPAETTTSAVSAEEPVQPVESKESAPPKAVSSKSKKKKRTSPVVWLRYAVQAFFLLFFLYLFMQTTYHPIDEVGGPVTFFFEIDPLVLIATWLANHAAPAILLLSLITLAVTFFFGRWFCGWVCPFGVLHNLFTSFRKKRLLTRIQSATFSPWQRGKYYILIAFLVGALLGVSAVGWLDPFSFFYRSLATAVYPAVNWGFQALFTWLYETDPGIGSMRVTAISEPIYDVLRANFLTIDPPPHFHWSLLIGFLFILVVGLNLIRARFWCRYICPLGALLGLVGKNPIVRIHKDTELCNDCRLCVTDCQGGAEPNVTGGWKPSECFYCWNCKSACPHDAISIRFESPMEKK